MKQPIFIRAYFEEKLQKVKQFSQEQIVIGQGENSDLEINHDSVSPVHAVIEDRNSRYYVSDLGSETGVLVNGKETLDQELTSGDIVSIGEYRLEFFIGIPKPVTPPKLPVAAPSNGIDAKEVITVDEGDGGDLIPEYSDVTVEISNSEIQNDRTEEISNLTDSNQLTIDLSKIRDEKNTNRKDEDLKENSVPTLPKDIVNEETPRIEVPEIPKLKLNLNTEKKQSRFSRRGSSGTFAPKSEVANIEEIVRPGKGSVVEVTVAWKERVISTNHFSAQGSYTIGTSQRADIILPLSDMKGTTPFLILDSTVKVLVAQTASGHVTNSHGVKTIQELKGSTRLVEKKRHSEIILGQGELLKLNFGTDGISIVVRYVPESVKPIVAPMLDFTTTEFTGIILALVISALLGLYMMVYSPSQLEDEALIEEPIRIAVVKFNRPKRKKKVVEVVRANRSKPKTVKVDNVKGVKKKSAPRTTKNKQGKSASIKSKNKKRSKKRSSSVKRGGAVKTGRKSGSNANSRKKDISKVGLLSSFGGKGINKALSKSYRGAGGLSGVAASATGSSGFNKNRRGKNLGTELKNTGAGGSGRATEGISGAGTRDRGAGNSGSGTGGLGNKGKVGINIGGSGAEISGTIDREAIRRVIRKNRRQIKACYDRELNRNKDLYGKLVLEWNIEEKGIVTQAKVKTSSLGSKVVANCIISRLRTWRFPEPPEDQVAHVVYPFVFQAQ